MDDFVEKLIRAKCILVGISPKMAISMGFLERDIPTYRSTYAGLEAIIEQQKHSIKKLLLCEAVFYLRL